MPFTIKQNDSRPRLVAVLKDSVGEDDEAPIDLSSAASVKVIIRPNGGGAVKVTATVTVLDDVNGVVSYEWQPGDTDTVGDFDVEWEITWADAGIETVPNDGYETVTVFAELG